jgi:uncharacterized membrane protein YbhN (UPF0104 family)
VAPHGSEEPAPGTGARRRVVLGALAAALVLAIVYVGLPAVAGLDDTWRRVRTGDLRWIAVGAILEAGSFAGYVLLVRTVLVRDEPRFGWRACLELTFAGVLATRLLSAAGAGGVALTAWAMRGAGMPRGRIVVRLTAFMVVLYGVFMAALAGGGLALVLEGEVPTALSVVPGAFGLAVIVAALSLSRARPRRDGAASRGVRLLAAGVREALTVARAREPGLLGAVGWWAFDIAVLAACFRAFGDVPPVDVLVMGYFVGMLANTLPLPGGVGGVDVGMVGAFAGLGVDAGLAVVAVLSYRMLAFWLPTAPGAVAYLRLRRDVALWRRAPVRNPGGPPPLASA